ncbi:MAG: class I SAM-dependent methyltransferase [Acidobacteria bacterium]|nr:class I SAM-dependent methyltransferase [Acidobacteriota bacterium]
MSITRRGRWGTVTLCLWKISNFLSNWLFPSRYRARRMDREFDKKFGVDTQGIIELEGLQITGENLRHGSGYEQTKPADFEKLMSALKIRYEDFVFVDFGSGKGRGLLLASNYSFRKIIGVEFATELHEAAQENIRRYRNHAQQCRNFELYCQDAVDFPIPRDQVVFYFYNPFNEEVMAKVLANIRQSIENHPREIFILYCNSVHRDLVRHYGFAELKSNRWHTVYRSMTCERLPSLSH